MTVKPFIGYLERFGVGLITPDDASPLPLGERPEPKAPGEGEQSLLIL